MQNEKEWDHKDEWRKRGDDFMVVVSRHNGHADTWEGKNRWAVYAYIYPRHSMFTEFIATGSIADQPYVPGHSYASFYRCHTDNFDYGEITSHQIGFDYSHHGDTHYTHMETKEDAYSVFSDAQELYDFLAAIAAARGEE